MVGRVRGVQTTARVSRQARALSARWHELQALRQRLEAAGATKLPELPPVPVPPQAPHDEDGEAGGPTDAADVKLLADWPAPYQALLDDVTYALPRPRSASDVRALWSTQGRSAADLADTLAVLVAAVLDGGAPGPTPSGKRVRTVGS